MKNLMKDCKVERTRGRTKQSLSQLRKKLAGTTLKASSVAMISQTSSINTSIL